MHSECYVKERLVSEFMLKFVYFQILLQFRTYIYYGTNLCRIYRDKYLTVRKISSRFCLVQLFLPPYVSGASDKKWVQTSMF